MKPAGPVARRADFVVDNDAQHDACAALVRLHHYARACANTSTVRTALCRGGVAIGAALWMPPTAKAAKAMAARHLGDEARHREVLVLSRLVVVPGEAKNTAGLLLGATTRAAWSDPRWSLLLTYADEGEGHTGVIYRATGWTFDGMTSPESRWRVDGVLVSRFSTKSRTVADMLAMGAVRTSSRKLRFVKLRP